MDWCLYKYRHLVENVFARLKHFRAMRLFMVTYVKWQQPLVGHNDFKRLSISVTIISKAYSAHQYTLLSRIKSYLWHAP